MNLLETIITVILVVLVVLTFITEPKLSLEYGKAYITSGFELYKQIRGA